MAKVGTAVAVGTLLLNLATPLAFASTTNLTISGNGADSENTVTDTKNYSNTVVQSNSATITNTITTNGNTGENSVKANTGGDVTVDTGDAISHVTVSNAANINKAIIKDCNCLTGTVNGTITGNGADSENEINFDTSTTNSVFQDNYALFANDITTNLNTGDNDAKENTGGVNGGEVNIETGDAGASVTLVNKANENLALIGSLGNGTVNGGINLTISGNGADSDNDVNHKKTTDNTVVQDNYADFMNYLTVNADTGDNDAKENTNQGVTIETGVAQAIASVTNKANFNVAAVDCGCLTTENKTVSGNGADSENEINEELNSTLSLFQGDSNEGGNAANFTNNLTVDPLTGDNDAKENTGSVSGGSDFEIFTGDSGSVTTVTNTANQNLFGTGSPALTFSFDLNGFAGFLGL